MSGTKNTKRKNRQRERDIAANIHRWERYAAEASPLITALAMVFMVFSLLAGVFVMALCHAVLWRVDVKEQRYHEQLRP